MVATVMIMIMGVAYNFYINMSKTYVRGSEKLQRILEASTWIEVISAELRSAARIIELKPDLITYQRYYEETESGKPDSVSDLNAIKTQIISIRARQEEDGGVILERKEGIGFYSSLQPAFKAVGLKPEIFRGWEAGKKGFEEYDSFDGNPEYVPMVEIRFEFDLKGQSETYYRRLFLPAVYGNLPQSLLPQEVLGDKL